MSSSPTRCINKVAKPSPSLRRHLDAPLGFPAKHSTSCMLGKRGRHAAARGEEGARTGAPASGAASSRCLIWAWQPRRGGRCIRRQEQGQWKGLTVDVEYFRLLSERILLLWVSDHHTLLIHKESS